MVAKAFPSRNFVLMTRWYNMTLRGFGAEQLEAAAT
jgi:hypothetical protein